MRATGGFGKHQKRFSEPFNSIQTCALGHPNLRATALILRQVLRLDARAKARPRGDHERNELIVSEKWCGRRDSNPHSLWPRDFKSLASTGFATPAPVCDSNRVWRDPSSPAHTVDQPGKTIPDRHGAADQCKCSDGADRIAQGKSGHVTMDNGAGNENRDRRRHA